MKKFRSNLQKVLDLCEQQRRLAQLELSRTQALLNQAQLAVTQAQTQLETARQEVGRAMQNSLQATLLLGMQQHLGAASDEIGRREQVCLKAAQTCDEARQKYQTLHSKVERIERLIEKQRDLYRRESFKVQQRAMDDVAIFRWQPSEYPEPEEHRINEVVSHG